MDPRERIRVLTGLGLTLNQARAFMALIDSGPATAKILSKTTGITQQDIYRVMTALQETGLSERLITTPTTFKAVPAEKGILMLLHRRTAEQKKLEMKTEELLNHIKTKHANHVQKKDHGERGQFALIPGKEYIIQKLAEALDCVQVNLETFTSKKRFSLAILTFAEGYQRAIERGVKIRIITEKHVADEKAVRIVDRLQKSGNFHVKYVQESPKAIVSIFDNKEAYITLSATANFAGTSGIWSNNPCFIEIAKNYFETNWNNALSGDPSSSSNY